MAETKMRIEISKEWCMRMARYEGNAEIGVGQLAMARQRLLGNLAAARRAADPLAELRRIAHDAGMRQSWIDQVRRTWGL